MLFAIFLIGCFGIFIVLLLKKPFTRMIGRNNKLAKNLKNAVWFQNHWLSGMLLFIINAVLFFSTVFLLYGLSYLTIPYLHLFVMLLAVIGSILLWIALSHVWRGTKQNRMRMSAVGSSFYFILSIIFIFLIVTLEPLYPGEDTFMRWIGLLIASTVTIVAFIICFAITGFSNQKER